MKWWLVSFVILILGFFLIREISNNRELKDRINIIQIENTILNAKIDSLENQNLIIGEEIKYLKDSISDLNNNLERAKKRKITVIEKVKSIEPINDTIKNFIELNQINDTIIRNLEKIVVIKDSIILRQKAIIQNDSIIKRQYQLALKNKDEEIFDTTKELKKEKTKKIVWQSTTGIAVGIIITLLLI